MIRDGAQIWLVAAEDPGGLRAVLYGQITVPFWVVSILVGTAFTAGLVYLMRRLAG